MGWRRQSAGHHLKFGGGVVRGGVDVARLVFSAGPSAAWISDCRSASRSIQPGPAVAILEALRTVCDTCGVSYLRKILDVVLFPEIWRLRTDL